MKEEIRTHPRGSGSSYPSIWLAGEVDEALKLFSAETEMFCLNWMHEFDKNFFYKVILIILDYNTSTIASSNWLAKLSCPTAVHTVLVVKSPVSK